MSVSPQDVPALETLRDWDRDDWLERDWAKWRGDLSPKRVIQGITYAADRELSWQGEVNSNTIRGLWYNPFKPILETVFPNRYSGPGTEHFNREMTKALSGAISDLVQDSNEPISYRGLNVLDESRERNVRRYGPESDRILFVESDGAYYSLKPLADVYRLTIVSGQGWQSTACIEDLSKELPSDREYTLWFVCDYDPAGFGIVEDFADRLERLGVDVDRQASRRLGIRPDQVSEVTIEQQSFVVGDSAPDVEQWKEEYGLGPGGRFGIELDAVGEELQGGARALRQLVSDEIRDLIRTDKRRREDVSSTVSTAAQAAVDDVLAPLRRNLIAEVVEELRKREDVTLITKSSDGQQFGVTFSGSDSDVIQRSQEDTALPTAYDREDLHTGAVSGTAPTPATATAEEWTRSLLQQAIEDRRVDLAKAQLAEEIDE